MLSVVSSRLEGGSTLNGVASWNKYPKPAILSPTTISGRSTRGQISTLLTTRRKKHQLLNTHSDLTENIHVEENEVETTESAPSTDPEEGTLSQSMKNQDPNDNTTIGSETPKRPQVSKAQKTLRVSRDERERIQRDPPPYRIGDLVTITVTELRKVGALVKLEEYPDQNGVLPINLFPLTLMSQMYEELEKPPSRSVFNNLKRRATIVRSQPYRPQETEGPVVNTYVLDRGLLMRRLQRLCKLCVDDKQTIKGYISERNSAGMVVVLAGFRCFLPRSLMTPNEKKFMELSDEDFANTCLGTELEVSVTGVDPERYRTVVSTKAVFEINALKKLQIGALVHGHVQGFVQYGAFITIEGTFRSGLLHLKNISGRIVRNPEEVFKVGDEVYAVVLDMNPDYSRIALSTSDLEEYDGEILNDLKGVMKNAPVMARRLQAELDEARATYRQSAKRDLDT